MSPPLIAPVEPENASPEQAALLSRLPLAGPGRFLAHAPGLADAAMRIGAQLMSTEESGLPAALREAIVVRTARLCGCAYVEVQHHRLGERLGIDPQALAAAAAGSGDQGLPEAWRPAIRVVEAAMSGTAPDAAAAAAVVADHGERGLVGLLLTAGFYSLMSYVATGLDLPAA